VYTAVLSRILKRMVGLTDAREHGSIVEDANGVWYWNSPSESRMLGLVFSELPDFARNACGSWG